MIDNGSHPLPIEVTCILVAIMIGIYAYVFGRIYIRFRGGKAK